MENKIEIFKNPSFGSVRAFVDDKGEPWFCGNDVATALGYANPRDALDKRCKTPGVVKRDVGVVTGKKAVRDHVTDKHKTLNESFTVNGTAI